jgi:hypothetical protein
LKVLDLLDHMIARWEVKLVLASLIVISLLPIPELRRFDSVFLAIFGVELAIRLAVLARARAVTRNEVVVLVADAVALISFLPIGGLVGARALRFVRLVRLVALARFLRFLVQDLRRILGQRQIRQQLVFLLAAVLLLTFLGTTVLGTFEVPVDDFDGDGRLDRGDLGQVMWWVFQQVESPDNLVKDPRSGTLLLVTSLALTIAGVFVMSYIIGIGTSVVGALMSASRTRPVQLRDHTVVIGGGRNIREVLRDLAEMYGKNRRPVRVALLDAASDPPPYLEEPGFRGIEYRTGEATDTAAHELLATRAARRVIVLNDDELGESSDAYVISAVLAVRQQNEDCPISVEMRHRRYLDMARVAGGQNVNPIPMGQFLGSVMCQSLLCPGIDEVFEDLLKASGSEVYTHIFSPEELDDLSRAGGRCFSFRDLLLRLQADFQVIPIGLLLGAGPWTHDFGELVVWLNPLEEPPEEAVALGARKGHAPCGSLRGLIAIAPEYATLRLAARESLCNGVPPDATGTCEPAGAGFRARLCRDMDELRRVLVLGVNEHLPTILENTSDFVEGVEIEVVLNEPHVLPLCDELRRRLSTPGEDVIGGVRFSLRRGGHATVVASRVDLLADALEREAAQERPLDAVLLLADHRETDPDASTTLTLLRLIEHLRDRKERLSPRFRIVAEVLSAPKGDLLERRLSQGTPWPVRVIPTRQMRAYYLVHSAYVPGSDLIHLELVNPSGQDLCQLRLDLEGEDVELDFRTLIDRLSRQDPPVICFAVRLGADHPRVGMMLNPGPEESRVGFTPSQLEAIYAIGETHGFAATSTGAPRRREGGESA